MLKIIPVLIITFVFCSIGDAQRLLFHRKTFRNAYYEVGDVISFRLKNEKIKRTGQIIGFEDDMVVFQTYEVNPNQISHLYFDEKTMIWYILLG